MKDNLRFRRYVGENLELGEKHEPKHAQRPRNASVCDAYPGTMHQPPPPTGSPVRVRHLTWRWARDDHDHTEVGLLKQASVARLFRVDFEGSILLRFQVTVQPHPNLCDFSLASMLTPIIDNLAIIELCQTLGAPELRRFMKYRWDGAVFQKRFVPTRVYRYRMTVAPTDLVVPSPQFVSSCSL